MSNKRTDPRFLRTEALLKNALMDEVARKGFGSVRIDGLCAMAGVNRATFYLHYRDKFELLEACLLSFFEKVEGSVAGAPTTDVETILPGLIRVAVESFAERREFILRVLEDGKFPECHALFSRRMRYEVGRLIAQLEREGRVPSSSRREHQVMFLSAAVFGSVLQWIKSGTPSELDRFCRDMASYAMAIARG